MSEFAFIASWLCVFAVLIWVCIAETRAAAEARKAEEAEAHRELIERNRDQLMQDLTKEAI